jgi:putative heme transporter
VAVFVVVILGTAVAGIMGALFAIPTAAAILSVTDYLRQRDVLLRADEPEDRPAGEADAVPAAVVPDATTTVEEA